MNPGSKKIILIHIILTLLYIILACCIYQFFLKKETVLFPFEKTAPLRIFSYYDGKKKKGKSEILDFKKKDVLKLRYILRESEISPYAGIVIFPEDRTTFPFVDFDEVKLRVRGENLEGIKFQMKVFQEGISIENKDSTYRRLAAIVPVTNSFKDTTITLDRFKTEAWWFKRNNLPEDTRLPNDFSKIIAFQLSDNSSINFEEELEFEVTRISLVKNPLHLFPALLSLAFIYYLVLLLRFLFRKRPDLSLITGEIERERNEPGSFHEMINLLDRVNSNEKGISLLDSLYCAQKIQESILPSNKNIGDHIDDFFILWRPKDIVGGDFYWFKPVDHGYLLAVIDCEGHGIPGAFMTMMTHSILERVADHCECSSPARMLMFINKIIQETRTISDDEHRILTEGGLDISLCLVKPDSKTLTFAGARQSLFYRRGNGVTQVKGDKASIGIGRTDINYQFSEHKINIKKGDTFYLTSDGLLDQDDLTNNLPLGKNRFTELLKGISDLPAAKQCTYFEAYLQKNVNSTNQVDDITLIGFSPFKK